MNIIKATFTPQYWALLKDIAFENRHLLDAGSRSIKFEDELPSGESKKPDEMTVRELQQLKRDLKERAELELDLTIESAVLCVAVYLEGELYGN